MFRVGMTGFIIIFNESVKMHWFDAAVYVGTLCHIDGEFLSGNNIIF